MHMYFYCSKQETFQIAGLWGCSNENGWDVWGMCRDDEKRTPFSRKTWREVATR